MAYHPVDVKQLDALSKLNGHVQVLKHLTKNELNSSASLWKVRHLIAFRLLVAKEETFLPIIKHDEQCPICGRESIQIINRTRTDAITGDFPNNLYTATDSEFLRSIDGHFWVALARATRDGTSTSQEPVTRPRRVANPVIREGFVNTSEALGSSSPLSQASSSSSRASSTSSPSSRASSSSSDFQASQDVGEDEHERRNNAEDVTVQLIYAFILHALNSCLEQNPYGTEAKTQVTLRIDRLLTQAEIAGGCKISAVDDGGVCLMRRKGFGWGSVHDFLAVIEAKRAFKTVNYDQRTGNYRLVMANEALAQYLGEAVTVWKEHSKQFKDIRKGVFLIAATNTFVSFIHFRFGPHYLEYLEAESEEEQMEIISDQEKDACVYMQRSKWHNLQSPKGRERALCHVLALLRWHEAQGSLNYGALEENNAMEESDEEMRERYDEEMGESYDEEMEESDYEPEESDEEQLD